MHFEPGAPRRTTTGFVVGAAADPQLEFSREAAAALLARGEFFWLDLERPQGADFAIMRELFGFHPLAVEDSERFGQRAKIDDYDDFVFIVAYGAARGDEDRLVEVHCFYSERFLLTVHHDDCPAFAELRRRYQAREDVGRPPLLLYRLLDGLVESFFPVLSDIDDAIDELETAMFIRPDDRQLQDIFAMKRLLVGMRKAIAPQRDAFASFSGRIAELPGMDADAEHYFRDVYDHLIRISELIDTYRDLLTSSMDVYLSTVSNRLNGVIKQLTVIATVFLPLSWLTGFFGQNFAFLVRNIGGWETFVGLGIGTEVLAVALLYAMSKRRGWF